MAKPSGTYDAGWSINADHLAAVPGTAYRYLCVYNSTDFRTYKQGGGGYANVEAQTLKFYVKKSSTTAIDNTEATESAVKFFENGQLLIRKNGVVYNAQGTVVR